MKWLIDAQLPPKLSSWFRTIGEDSIHVQELASGLSLSDEFLWNYAKREGRIIVTKDRDFFERSILLGSPPQVLFIQVGNCSNERLISILALTKNHWLSTFAEKHSLIVLTPTGSQTF